jgi:hypothetical protein
MHDHRHSEAIAVGNAVLMAPRDNSAPNRPDAGKRTALSNDHKLNTDPCFQQVRSDLIQLDWRSNQSDLLWATVEESATMPL